MYDQIYLFQQTIILKASEIFSHIIKDLLINDPDIKHLFLSSDSKNMVMEKLIYKLINELENYKERERFENLETYIQTSTIPVLNFGIKYITYYFANTNHYPTITNQ